MTALTILSNPIRQLNGLYSLNDLHKASGGKNRHRPAFFMRLDTTQELIAEIETAQICAVKTQEGNHSSDVRSEEIQCADMHSAEIEQTPEMVSASKVINGGVNRGTYACRELVIAYAAWISAAFHLKVIRVFLNQQTQPPEDSVRLISPEQEGIISNLMAIRFPEGKDRPYCWSRFNRHFVVSSYKNLPASKFAEACIYIPSMPDKKVKGLPAPDLSTLIPRLEWTQPDPIGRRDSVRNYVATEKLIMELKAWADSLPRDIGSPLRAALNDLNNLLVTGWTEVDEALSCITQGMNYLHRWQGRNGRIGNVG